MDLTSKIILVTGGGSGIGLELTRQLVALGNTVIVCGRDAGKLAEAARLTGAQAIAGDVTVAEDQERILSDVQAQHGRLDLLINNAGVFFAYHFRNDPDALQKIENEIAINAAAPLTLTRRALPLLEKSAQPGVLFIGSGIAFVASPGTPVYSGTKALIHHCAQTLRHQLQPHGITVFEALPPVVDTDMAKVLKSGNFKKMKPADLVRDILEGLRRNQTEMLLGQSSQIKWMSRIAPAFLFRQFAKTEFH
ncbi:SDR family NAD(P)-dependent oxidoreductase [Rhodobacter sp. NTK016B]|uniref:SDR family oxidoreductase n=1 Tax=Rhodobacter sp. NTK016B TaxID=2759676 RepID=UPI001A8D68ED|nr:SDR family NAD(P)-dependent oxidoreductase [Rhodobacter sp. NTK016B]MBN8294080.1 SDR family NAD(P)-dependent oxidoreductase [Rhodobacter sp. NTK016B]